MEFPIAARAKAMLRAVKVAVAGYGKLGGLELGYGSDLDLVFLHDSSGDSQQTRRAIGRWITRCFFAPGQRIVHLLTMHSAAGRLYEVDMRLRPNGKGGFLMTGIDAFERYQREEAWTWEHQALLRARAIGGDANCAGASSGAAYRAALRRASRHVAHGCGGDAPCACAANCRWPARASSTSNRMPAASPTSNSWCSTGCWHPPASIPSCSPSRIIFGSSMGWRPWACSTTPRRGG
jgi:hypothetical protein